MHLTTLFASLSTLLTIAAAIPVAQDPSKPSKPVISSTPTPTASTPTPSMITMVGPYQCPPNQQKQCCQSLQETSHDIMKGLGELVPILGGIQVSSKISFQCKNMTPEESPNSCKEKEYSPMCCSKESSNGIGLCKPFAVAKEEYYKSFGYGQESQVDYINDAVD
ncbi:hypothetical protein PENDEC_c015G00849 [Penicillium decumbens]|uniref:Hydrophobin n=1 Tax=Penicillium decumbens TaxID=69771 RepID=A0A1V6P8T0_PENDC|nr:hypothetical protein PENDEC_c015G00849 [Penicillium decumbens]